MAQINILQDPISPSSSVAAGGQVPHNVLREPSVFNTDYPGRDVQHLALGQEMAEISRVHDTPASSRKMQQALEREKTTRTLADVMPPDPEEFRRQLSLRSLGHSSRGLRGDRQPGNNSPPYEQGPRHSQTLSSMINETRDTATPAPANGMTKPQPQIDDSTPPHAFFPTRDFSPSRTGLNLTTDEVLCILYYSTTTIFAFSTIARMTNHLFARDDITQYDVNRVLTVAERRIEEHRPWFPGHGSQRLQPPTGPETRPCFWGMECSLAKRTEDNDVEEYLEIGRSIWALKESDDDQKSSDIHHVCLGGISPLTKTWRIVRNINALDMSPRRRRALKAFLTALCLTTMFLFWMFFTRYQKIDHPISKAIIDTLQKLWSAITVCGIYFSREAWGDVREGGKRFLIDLMVNLNFLGILAWIVRDLW